MKALIITLIVVTLAAGPAMAQEVDTASVWRTFAGHLEVGAAVKMRLRNGQAFRATLVQARPDVLLVQPKTRIAVPVQPVAYDAIVSIDRERTGGMGPGKAAAIGVAAGAATFVGVLLILFATFDD
jgi:hypothetical protein